MDIYLVGGAVRDKLLGYPVKERDWVVVGATVEDMLQQGFKPVGKDFPVFLHPETSEEYALARTERKTAPGYTGFAFHSTPDVTLEEDLIRRDLTVNAMAERSTGEIIDPYHGQADLRKRILRHVSPAFSEDPVRILRTARFLARYFHLGFRIADETVTLMQTMVGNGEANHLVAERVWKEWERSLTEQNPEQFIIALDQCGALQVIMPELAESAAHTNLQSILKPFVHLCEHHIDTVFRFSALLSILGVSASLEQLQHLCDRLGAPKKFREMAGFVAQGLPLFANLPNQAPEQIVQWFKHLDIYRKPERFEQWLSITVALFNASEPQQKIEKDQIQNNAKCLKAAYTACVQVTATDLMQQGIQGKALGNALEHNRINLVKDILT